jgi:hypothetical protein
VVPVVPQVTKRPVVAVPSGTVTMLANRKLIPQS